jgi:NAD+ kinase
MKKIALFISQDKSEALHWAEEAAAIIQKLEGECCADPILIEKIHGPTGLKAYQTNEFDKFADLVISFGGDGTILGAARELSGSDLPIMGVNVGKLGFLAEYPVEQLEQSIRDVMEGRYRIVDRVILEAEIDGEMILGLNDFVIEKKDSSRMINVHAYSNNHFIADYRADGLILNTPTGSTAYSLSCGGPILLPSAEVFCLTPISPHSLNLRPLVIPDKSEIMLRVYSPTGEASFVADGQIKRVLGNGESINCRKSESRIKLIKPPNSSYFDLIRKKLLWAANADDIKEKNG